MSALIKATVAVWIFITNLLLLLWEILPYLWPILVGKPVVHCYFIRFRPGSGLGSMGSTHSFRNALIGGALGAFGGEVLDSFSYSLCNLVYRCKICFTLDAVALADFLRKWEIAWRNLDEEMQLALKSYFSSPNSGWWSSIIRRLELVLV